MPAIPLLEQRTLSSQAGLPAGPSNIPGSGLEAIGHGLSAVGDTVAQGQLLEIKKQNEDAAAAANDELMQSRTQWIQELTQRKLDAPPGASGFTPTLMKDFDEDAAKRLATAQTPQAKRYLTNRLADVRLGLYQDAVGFESQEATKHRLDLLKSSQDNAETAAEFHPETFTKLWAEQSSAIDASGIDPSQREAVATSSRLGLADASVRGMIRYNPRQALKALNDQNSKAPAIQALDFPDRERLRAAAETEVRRLDELARVAQDKREADGERAVNEYYRQIGTGVPATPVMQLAWQRRVKGTSSAPEFADLLKGEQTVQEVLTRPPAEQVAYVQQKQAELDKGGGDLKDIAFLQRLSGAVTKNVQTLQNAPILYNAQRTGADVQPLDWSALEAPEGVQTVGTALADRFATIGAMQKRFGAVVQNKPLLPQEAATLAGAIDQATPAQATSIFGALRNASGSDANYRAVLQQVSPDSPVKALAGLLASKQRDITLQRNWFSSNVVASSPDVATTMLNGEALLNKSKAAKSEDGKPKAGLYLPADNALQSDFQNAVGSAFADRPGAADIAFQAVQAYYVGKASQTGRLAANNQDVDSKILKEAITAVLGTVVDYNGNGQVLAPWGMDRSQFESSVQDAYQRAVKAGQIPAVDAGQLGAMGLRNAGDGTYYVTAGRKFVSDSTGRPIILNVGSQDTPPPAPPTTHAPPAHDSLYPANLADQRAGQQAAVEHAKQARPGKTDVGAQWRLPADDPRVTGQDQPTSRGYPVAQPGDPEADSSTWDPRADGSQKGQGFLGLLKRPDGGVSSEISIGVKIGGKEVEIPTMVPSLTDSELKYLMTHKPGSQDFHLPDSIKQKAIAHAKARIADGKSPFRQAGE